MLAVVSTAVLAFLVAQAQPAAQQPAAAAQSRQGDARTMTLRLPHALHKGEAAFLLVKVGSIDHHEVRLTTKDGHPLGTISPFGVRSGHDAGTYTIPVPAGDFHDRKLALRISIVESDGGQRAPTSKEVESVRLRIEPEKP